MGRFSIMVLVLLCFSSCGDDNELKEISLYNERGEATAYYSLENDEQIIYLWDGQPTSYIVVANQEIFGFNGMFLGWKENGLLYDLSGARVGFEKDALNITTLTEPAKLVKGATPSKMAKLAVPAKPAFIEDWSSIDLRTFLEEGI